MNREKRDLIADLMGEEPAARREAVLLAGASVMRQRRWRRMTWQGVAGMAVLAIALLLVIQPAEHKPAARIVAAQPKAEPGSLTDEELLNLFPNKAVALIMLKNGQERFYFLNPTDQQKLEQRL